jgi:hypothetical protein
MSVEICVNCNEPADTDFDDGVYCNVCDSYFCEACSCESVLCCLDA